jgi:hypothetical protein
MSDKNQTDDLYKILGVNHSATKDEVTRAFRKMARIYHPDKVMDEQAKKSTEEIFKKINAAHKILTNDTLRDEYMENAPDDDSLQHVDGYINIGNTMSQEFKIRLNKWMVDATKISFDNNIQFEINTILKEIVQPALATMPTIVAKNNYKCEICNLVSSNQLNHESEFVQKYIDLIKSTKTLSLVDQMLEIFGSEAGQWQPVSFVPIKQSMDQLQYNIKNAKRISSDLQKLDLQKLDKIPEFANCVKICGLHKEIELLLGTNQENLDCVLSASDCNFIKKQIDNKKSSFNQSLSILQAEENCKKSGIYKIIDGIDKYISIVPQIVITFCPQIISSAKHNNCNKCSTVFGLSKWKYNCRRCGEIFCTNCLVNSPVPRLGYFFNVKICSECKHHIEYEDPLEWLQYAKQCNDTNEAAKMITISSLYKQNDSVLDKMMENLGDYYYGLANFTMALHCYQYTHLLLDKWLEIIINLLMNKQYKCARTCAKRIRHTYQFENDKWISHGTKYLQKIDYAIVAVFFFNEGKISYKRLCDKIVEFRDKNELNICDILLDYMTMRYTNNKSELEKIAEIFFKSKIYDLGMYFYHKSGYLVDNWILLTNNLCRENLFVESMQVWSSVTKIYNIDTNISTKYLFTKYLHAFVNNNIVPHQLITDLVVALENKSTDDITIILAYVLAFCCVDLKALIDSYVTKKEYNKALICFWIFQFCSQTNSTWVDFGNNFLEQNCIIEAFQCYDYADVIWKEMGDNFFTKKRYTSALNCYLLMKDYDTDKHIFNKAVELISMAKSPKAFIYFVQLAKQNKMVKEIIRELGKNIGPNKIYNNNLKNLIMSYLVTPCGIDLDDFTSTGKFTKVTPCGIDLDDFTSTGKFTKVTPCGIVPNSMDKQHVFVHDCICKLLETENCTQYLDEIIGCLHIIGKFDTSNYAKNRLAGIIDIYHMTGSIDMYDEIKKKVYSGESKEIATWLLDLNNSKILAIKRLYSEQVGNLDIITLPDNHRCIIYLLRAALFIYEEKYIDALDDLRNSLICFPVNDHSEAVSILLQSDKLQLEIYRHFIHGLTLLNGRSLVNIEIPTLDKYQNFLKGNKTLTMIKKFEKAINNRIKDHEEAGLLYMDLCMAIGDAAGLAGCFIMSAYYFMKALNQTPDFTKAYAYRNAVFDMCVNAYEISHRHLVPTIQIHFNKQIVSLIINSNVCLYKIYVSLGPNPNKKSMTKLIGPKETYMLTTTILSMVNLAKISPITNLPIVLGCDTIYFDLVSRNYSEGFLTELSKNGSSLCPRFLADYYLLESSWKHWFANENNNFQDHRIKSMKSLLESNGWDMSEVEFLLSWPLFPKDDNGWIHPRRSSLNFVKESFRRIHGVQINKNTGEVFLLLEDAVSGNGLFTYDDINTIMVLNIQHAMFTLDQPDTNMRSHPFQEAKYFPAELYGTDYWATLMHTDCVLKMLSIGIDICSKAPFNFRNIKDGMINKLPSYLRETIKPIYLRKKYHSHDTAHRFWIEAGELVYEIEENNDSVTWKFADIKMSIKKHLLRYDESGKLIDDDNDVESDDSAEAEFAKQFTDSYDKIGSYFPELLRLKELRKLSGALTILRNVYFNAKETVENFTFDISTIEKDLASLSSQIGEYPTYTESNVLRDYNSTLRVNGLNNDSRVAQSEITRVKESIRTNLKQSDQNTLTQVTKILTKGYHCSPYDIGATIELWLRNRSGHNSMLTNVLAGGIKKYIISQKNKIINGIKAMRVNTCMDKDNISLGNNGKCSWIPAAFFNNIIDEKATIKVYGGVNLCSNMRQGSVSGGGGSSGNGNYGSHGSNSIGGGARYVERMDASGKVWGTCTNSNGAVVWTGYKATNPNNLTQQYFRPMTGGPTHHTTLHRDGNYNVHHTDGTTSRY